MKPQNPRVVRLKNMFIDVNNLSISCALNFNIQIRCIYAAAVVTLIGTAVAWRTLMKFVNVSHTAVALRHYWVKK